MPNALIYPQINGYRPDFSSIEVSINGKRYVGFKGVSYKDSKKPGEIRGTAAQLLGRTRGTYSAEGSIEAYKVEWADMLATSFAAGYLDTPFLVTATYAEPIAGILIVDTLIGAIITDVDESHQQGSDPLSVKLSLHIMRINRNGRDPLGPAAMIK